MEKKDHVQQMRTVLILEVLLFFSGFLVYWDYVFGNHFLAFGTFADVGSDTVQPTSFQTAPSRANINITFK